MTDLPPSWKWTTVGEAGHVELGVARNPSRHHGPNLKPYLRVANVFENRFDYSDVKEMHFSPQEFDHYALRPGDVLLNEGQSPELLGRPALYDGAPDTYAFTNSLIRFQAGPAVLPAWALLVFRHYMHSGRFTREVRITTNIAHLSAGRFKTIELPVPPLAEQSRIVNRVTELVSTVANGQARVHEAQAKIEDLSNSKFMQLTANERCPTVRLEKLLREPLANGRSVPTRTDGFRVLRLTAIKNGSIDLSESKGGDWTADKALPFLVERDDFLVSRGNGSLKLVGKGGLVEERSIDVAFPDTMIRLRADGALVRPRFLRLAWDSPSVRAQIERKARTTAGIYKISQADIRTIDLPCPPLGEQDRIVEELDEIERGVRSLLNAVRETEARGSVLTSEILSNATTGRLIVQ